mgnify:FL=1
MPNKRKLNIPFDTKTKEYMDYWRIHYSNHPDKREYKKSGNYIKKKMETKKIIKDDEEHDKYKWSNKPLAENILYEDKQYVYCKNFEIYSKLCSKYNKFIPRKINSYFHLNENCYKSDNPLFHLMTLICSKSGTKYVKYWQHPV